MSSEGKELWKNMKERQLIRRDGENNRGNKRRKEKKHT